MKNYDEIIDKTMCARCLEIKREQFPNTRCPWRSIDNEYCGKAQELADYIQELKERCSKSSFKDSWKNKYFKAKEERDLYKQQVDIAQESHFITYETAKKNTAKEILQDLFYFIDGNNFWLEETGNQVFLIKEKDALIYMRAQASKYEVEVEE